MEIMNKLPYSIVFDLTRSIRDFYSVPQNMKSFKEWYFRKYNKHFEGESK